MLVTLAAMCACGSRERSDEQPAAQRARAPQSTRPDTTRAVVDTTTEAGGEVVGDSQPRAGAPVGKWITDANVLSLLSTMNAKQIAAANIELGAWHTDTVRAFAATMAREHAELQHSIDSLSERTRIAPVAPALAGPIAMMMQAQIDSIAELRGKPLDRGFVREQAQSHALMADYVAKLAGVAENPELQALLSSTATHVTSELSRARTLEMSLARADSVVLADSLAKLTARAARDSARAAVRRRRSSGR